MVVNPTEKQTLETEGFDLSDMEIPEEMPKKVCLFVVIHCKK